MKNYRLGIYEKAMPDFLSYREKLSLAKRCGYDFVELSIDETEEKLSRLDMSKEQRREICDMELELGISFESICLSAHRKYPLGSSDPYSQARSMEIMEKAIHLAADLGIRMIQIAGYDVYYEQSSEATRASFEKNLRRSVELAAMQGVLLAFETMETEFMDTVEKARYWVDKIGSPYLCVYPDTGNITNAALLYHTSELQDIRQGAGCIAAIHLKESLPGKYREIPYGTGQVKFRQIIGEGLRMGVRRYLAEFWYKGEEDWEENLKRANAFLRNFFAQEEAGTMV